MKNYYYRFILAIIIMICPVVTNAQDGDFEIDGIYYVIKSENTVELSSCPFGYKNYFKSVDLVIPDKVENEGKSYKVVSIADGAFSNCGSLTSVVVPEGVEYLGNSSFLNCQRMKNITIPNTVKVIGHYAFSNCKALTEVTIPNGVTSIGDRAFRDCENLTSVTIPASVKSIGSDLFSFSPSIKSLSVQEGNSYYDSRNNCNAIIQKEGNVLLYGSASTIIPNTVDSIARTAFNCCRGLTEITIPEGVKKIGEWAFSFCYNLRNVNISNTVTTIDNSAFEACSSLKSIFIPKGVSKIGNGVFANCGEISSIKVDEENKYYDSRENCNALICKDGDVLIRGCVNTSIPNSVKTIGSYAFSNCEGLKSIIIPDNVIAIELGAFSQCGDLEEIKISGNVRTLGDYIAWECEKLTTLTLKEGLESIGRGAFSGCTKLTSIDIPKSVISIKDDAFWGCGIQSLLIPGNVKTIGDNAFKSCPLTSMEIMGGVTSIGNDAFRNCTQLTSVTIPNTVTTIGKGAFQNCLGLMSVTIPNSVTSLGSCAFADCGRLQSVELPEHLTVLSDSLFYRVCRDVKIPNNVITIGDYAMFTCRTDSLVIPSSVLNIGTNALPYVGSAISNFAEIPQSLDESYKYKFDNKSTPLHVCKGLKDVYEASEWGKYFTIIDDLPNSPVKPVLPNGSTVVDADLAKLTVFQLKTTANVAVNKEMRAKLYANNQLIGEAGYNDVTLANGIMTINFNNLATAMEEIPDMINTQIVVEAGSINVDNVAFSRSLSFVYETSRSIADVFPTGIDIITTTTSPRTSKRIVNGSLVIEKGGKQYTVDGKVL